MEQENKSFEQNLAELEQIAQRLERSDIPLKDALENFEKARNLFLVCRQTLTQVEGTVRKLTEDDQLVDFLKSDADPDAE